MKKIVFLAFSLLLFSCGTYSDEQIKEFDTEIKSYITDNKLDFENSSSGLYFNVIEEGEGDNIQLNDYVTFDYVGKLLNGSEFDNTKKEPVKLKVASLIEGWKEMMVSMKPGGEVELIIPPHLGYGTNDLDKIPPNSILYFYIKIIDVE